MLGSIMAGIDAISGLANILSTNKSEKNAGSDSDFAALLAKAQAAQDTTPTAAEPDELLASYQKNLHDFRERMEQLLAQLGIDTNGQPLQVQLNILNQLCVSGKHPQLEEVQAAVQQDPQLASLFTTLQQQAAQLEAKNNPSAKSEPAKPFALQIDGAQLTPVKYEIS